MGLGVESVTVEHPAWRLVARSVRSQALQATPCKEGTRLRSLGRTSSTGNRSDGDVAVGLIPPSTRPVRPRRAARHSAQLDAHERLDCASRASRITAPRSSTRIQHPQWRSDSVGCNPGWDALNSKKRLALRAGPSDRASRSQWNCSSNCYKCGRRCR